MYKEWQNKFLAKQRQKMGDEAFLRKYIKQYKNTDKMFKVIWPLCIVLSAILNILWIVTSILSFSIGNILLVGITFLVVICFFVINFMYCNFVSEGMFGKKIKEWEEEQANLTARNNN